MPDGNGKHPTTRPELRGLPVTFEPVEAQDPETRAAIEIAQLQNQVTGLKNLRHQLLQELEDAKLAAQCQQEAADHYRREAQIQREIATATWDRQRTRGARQHFSIPNNPLGWVWLWFARRWLNGKSYKVTKRGRQLKVRKARGEHREAHTRLLLQCIEHPEHSYYHRKGLPLPSLDQFIRGHYRDSIPLRYAGRIGVYIDRRPVTKPA